MDPEEDELSQLDAEAAPPQEESWEGVEASFDEAPDDAAPEADFGGDLGGFSESQPADASDAVVEEVMAGESLAPEEAPVEEQLGGGLGLDFGMPQLGAPMPEAVAPSVQPEPVAAPPAMPEVAAPSSLDGSWADPFGRQQGFVDPTRTADPAAVAMAQQNLRDFWDEAQLNYSPQGYTTPFEYMREKGAYNRSDFQTGWLGQAQALAKGNLGDGPRGQTWEPHVGWGNTYPADRLGLKPAAPPPQMAQPGPMGPARDQGRPAPGPVSNFPQDGRFDAISQQLQRQGPNTGYSSGRLGSAAGGPQSVVANVPGNPDIAAIAAQLQGMPGGTAYHAGQVQRGGAPPGQWLDPSLTTGPAPSQVETPTFASQLMGTPGVQYQQRTGAQPGQPMDPLDYAGPTQAAEQAYWEQRIREGREANHMAQEALQQGNFAPSESIVRGAHDGMSPLESLEQPVHGPFVQELPGYTWQDGYAVPGAGLDTWDWTPEDWEQYRRQREQEFYERVQREQQFGPMNRS